MKDLMDLGGDFVGRYKRLIDYTRIIEGGWTGALYRCYSLIYCPKGRNWNVLPLLQYCYNNLDNINTQRCRPRKSGTVADVSVR